MMMGKLENKKFL